MTHSDRRDFLRNLRQARQYLDRPVPHEIVERLLEAARTTGAEDQSVSLQFQVVDDLATKKALASVGILSEFLANVAVAIVIVIDGDVTSSKAGIEGRVADRIMRTANDHGLASGTGWFNTDETQEAARAILGIAPNRHVYAVVGTGYPEDPAAPAVSSLERIRKSLDSLTSARNSDRPDSQ